MKKIIGIPLIIINILFIISAMLTEKIVFLSIYRTSLFWGVSLYALTASIIILINSRRFPVFMWVNILLTIMAILWFFIYMPNYTPDKAIEKIENDPIFSDYTFITDHTSPIVKSNISTFVKGSYKFTDKDNYDISVVFNPMSGEYHTSFAHESKVYLPTDLITTIDRSFEEEYNLNVDKDNYTKINILLKYKKIWLNEVNDTYNKLLALLSDDNKILLINDQKSWTDNYVTENTLVNSILADRYKEETNLDLYDIEYSLYNARTRALKLKRIYERVK